ncbi:FtsX-like permease family protein [Kribbella sp. CA-247076]|uniref:ABC transporter permease n=1 Tax=Kribbella sp. CA-247076 TaxID=3239941 RepID=UPI003D92F870
MGRTLLAFRLVLADIRRHPAQTAMLLLAMTAATATLSLGTSLRGATDELYQETRAITAGPDVVALAPTSGDSATSALAPLPHEHEVVDHSGPYRQFHTTLAANGSTSRAVAQEAGETPDAIGRPLVTAGEVARPGGLVIERGFAKALGVGVGDTVSVAGREFGVAGIAVSAANMVYPWAAMIGPGGGPSDYSGLVWLSPADARTLAAAELPATTVLYLKLGDAAATDVFVDANSGSPSRVHLFSWQFIAKQDSVILRDSQPILVVGSWLLSFLAIAGVATLAAGRAARQTRRVGLLKAVGAAPGLIAAVLFAEYLVVALIADALGLTVARLGESTIVNPTASLISRPTGPTATTVAITTAFAVAVAILSTLAPTVRALRTETVVALADSAHRPHHRAGLTRLSAYLPTPLLLGLRLIARRPGRAVLHGSSIAVTLIGATALVTLYAQPAMSYGLDSPELGNLRADQGRHVLLAVTVALIALAAVNVVAITWTTAVEARPVMAIGRTLGATPGQLTAGLSAAQLLPTVPGAVAGVFLGIAFVLPFSRGPITMPSSWWLVATGLASLLATAALTALPAHLTARRSVAQTLSAEGT